MEDIFDENLDKMNSLNKLMVPIGKTVETLTNSVLYVNSKMPVSTKTNRESQPENTFLNSNIRFRIVSVNIEDATVIVSIQQPQIDVFEIVVMIQNLVVCAK